MRITWTRLPTEHGEVCASAEHAKDVRADWRMDAGGVGSYYCETCRYIIQRGFDYGGIKTIQIVSTPDK